MGNVMLVKLLVVLSLAAGMIQCKTSKVKSPQRTGGNGADAGGQSFDMPKFLLTQNSKSDANLNVKAGSVEVDPYLIGDSSLIVVSFAPEKASDAHYGLVKICFDEQRQCFPDIYTPLFLTEFAPPKTYNSKLVKGAMSVQVRACNASDRSKSGCGAWSERVIFSLSGANPETSDQKSLLDQRAANQEQLINFVKNNLADPAAKFKAAFEEKYKYPSTKNYLDASKEEQMLYTTAHNVQQAPWAMSAVYSSAILESMADAASEDKSGDGLALASEKELGEKTDITNVFSCEAAGYIWVNEERACYQPKKEEGNYNDFKIHKRWTNASTITGGVLVFAAIAGGGTWYVNDYIQANRQSRSGLSHFIEELDKGTYGPLNADRKLSAIKDYSAFIKRGGRFRQPPGSETIRLFDSDNRPFSIGTGSKKYEVDFSKPSSTRVYPVTGNTIAKASILSAAAFVGSILFVDGVTGYNLAASSTYQDHLKAFKASLTDNSRKLAELKKTQCSIEKQLFGTECN